MHINYINFDEPEKNVFKIVNQYSVQGERLRSPDLLLFINGIPVAVFEFKSVINKITTEKEDQAVIPTNKPQPKALVFWVFRVMIKNRRKEAKMSELIENRRSIRKFKSDKPVTREQLDRLLEAAMLAPSACNTRPWEFIAITSREILDDIARIHPYAKMCATATAAIIIVAIPQTEPLPSGFYPQDCGAATQNILLEAVSLGLGTCWCGVYPKEERMAEIRGLLGIQEPKIPFNVIAIGTPDEAPDRRGSFEKAKVTYIG